MGWRRHSILLRAGSGCMGPLSIQRSVERIEYIAHFQRLSGGVGTFEDFANKSLIIHFDDIGRNLVLANYLPHANCKAFVILRKRQAVLVEPRQKVF